MVEVNFTKMWDEVSYLNNPPASHSNGVYNEISIISFQSLDPLFSLFDLILLVSYL